MSGVAITQRGDGDVLERAIDLAAYASWQPTDSGTWFLEGDATSSYHHNEDGLKITVDLPRVKTDASEGGGISRHLEEAVFIRGMGAVRVVWSSEMDHGAN